MIKKKFIKLSAGLFFILAALLCGCDSASGGSPLGSEEGSEVKKGDYKVTICYYKNETNNSTEKLEEDHFFKDGEGVKKIKLTSMPFTYDGYYFAGWTKFQSSGSIDYYDGDEISVEFSGKKSVTVEIYGHWYYKGAYNKITYSINDDSASPKTINDFNSKQYTSTNVLDNPFTREGYGFLGWASNPDATEPEYTKGQSVTLSGDITLYAVWFNATKVTIYIHPNDDNLQTIKKVIDVPELENDKYVFVFDANEPFGRIKGKYVKGFKDEDGREIYKNTLNLSEYQLKQVYKNRIDIYAVWETGSEYIQITLYSNYGENEVINTEAIKRIGNRYYYCSSYNPEREGFYFLGWSTDKDCVYTDDDEQLDLYYIDPLEDDVKYYAIWSDKTKVTYILFDFYEDKDNPDYITILPYEDYFRIPQLGGNIIRNGKAFLGWQTWGTVYNYAEYYIPGYALKFNDEYLQKEKNIIHLNSKWISVDDDDAVKINFHNNIPGEEDQIFVQWYELRYRSSTPMNLDYNIQIFTRDNYDFRLWSENPDDKVGGYSMYGGDAQKKKEHDLYAIWSEKKE